MHKIIMNKLTPYLVQRGKITSELRDYSKGIDQYVTFEYMGSAEFEWGALPKSLERIRKNADTYEVMPLSVENIKLIVLAPRIVSDLISDYITGLRKGEFRLKERSAFEKAFDFDPKRCNFWWDIDNDIMFWISHPKLDNEFVKTALKR